MKKLFFIIAFLTTFIGQAQEEPQKINYDKTVTMYKTYADFKGEKGVMVGQLDSFSWHSWGGNTLHVTGGKQEKVNMNDYWGFTVGDFLFRSKQNGMRIPVVVLNVTSKIYYCEGYMFLDMIRANSTGGSSSRTDESIFYSDDMEGDIMEITKIISKEKDNPELAGMVECIKKGKKRRGYQAQFNSFYECITKTE